MAGLAYRRAYAMNNVQARRPLIEMSEEAGSLSEMPRPEVDHLGRKPLDPRRARVDAGQDS